MYLSLHQSLYELSIKWGGNHVKGSPFKLNMLGNAVDELYPNVLSYKST